MGNPKLSGRRVFVVEGEALLMLFIQDLLDEAGAVIAGHASTVANALATLVTTVTIDVAILDLNLGGEMSAPVADALARRGVPFVITTAYGMPADLLPGHEAALVLRKPYSGQELVEKLARLCSPA